MRTYSHVAVTWLAARLLAGRRVRVRLRPLLLGALAPDLPLIALSLGYFLLFRTLQLAPDTEFFALFDTLYRQDARWIALHNSLHAPPLLLVAAAGAWWAHRRGLSWAGSVLWFVAGAGLHSLTDILTHHSDGPLLLFPFDWSLRFASPVSYWNPNHYGAAFTALEHAVDALLLVLLGRAHLRKHAATAATAAPATRPLATASAYRSNP